MNYIPVSYNDIQEFSPRDLAFINQDERLTSFISDWASIEAFGEIIKAKQKHAIDRPLLSQVIQNQYQKVDTDKAVTDHIQVLKDSKCFTVITAHQPSLFTGPLYYFYKIASAINLAKTLKASYPAYSFVPIFISGGEDHDFEEVNHLEIFKKELTWSNNETGSVGRMSTAGLQSIHEELTTILGSSEFAQEISKIIGDAIAGAQSYSDVNFHIINTLFGKHGLVYVNMDNADFKRAFIPIIKDELENQSSESIVNQSIASLEKLGLKGQATPRQINFFYLQDGMRERIIFEDNVYKVLNTELSFEKEELLTLVEQSPEKFSPNVLMRPLYQETIFPNLAYIGGGGEIAYWTERKTQFAHYNIPFPLLIRRNSVLQINKGAQKQVNKTQFQLTDFLQPEQGLINRFLQEFVKEDIDLSSMRESIEQSFAEIAEKAKQIEEPLAKYVLAESSKQLKAVDNIEAKLKRALKSKNEVQLNKISSIRQRLFPAGGLQERKENFTMYYASQGQAWVDSLVEHLDPLKSEFLLALED